MFMLGVIGENESPSYTSRKEISSNCNQIRITTRKEISSNFN